MTTIDALLAELAASELAFTAWARESNRLTDAYGADSVEVFCHSKLARRLHDRREASVKAITAYAIEHVKSFVTPANQVGT